MLHMKALIRPTPARRPRVNVQHVKRRCGFLFLGKAALAVLFAVRQVVVAPGAKSLDHGPFEGAADRVDEAGCCVCVRGHGLEEALAFTYGFELGAVDAELRLRRVRRWGSGRANWGEWWNV
jgi:hypothetical protein